MRQKRWTAIQSKNIKDYFKYSISEVIFVMIGILLALQVNNWNERRKNNILEKEIYESFLTTLTKDSIELARIADIFNNGFNAQKYFLNRDKKKVLQENSLEKIEALLLKTLDVSHSFFPRYGIYQEVLNNGELALLRSDDIKNQLTEIYERKYRLYEHVDATVEEKIHFDLQPVVKGKYQLFLSEDQVVTPDSFHTDKFMAHYDDFTFQLRSMNSILGSTQNIHKVMGENIDLALELLREEL